MTTSTRKFFPFCFLLLFKSNKAVNYIELPDEYGLALNSTSHNPPNPPPNVSMELPPLPALPDAFPVSWPWRRFTPVISDYHFCQSGESELYNPLIGIFAMFRFDLLCMFGHHVRHSEVLWLERPVPQPGYQFTR
jgi:hypothetical protein